MDYEKAYKDALERAKKILEFYKDPAYTEVYAYAKEDIPSIFPELAQSEDERIRKMLITIYKKTDMGGEIFGESITYKQVVSWLEKQGEQRPADKVEPKFKVGDWVVHNNANVYQVKKIDYACIISRYELENIDGDKLSVPFTSDYNLRNWTIQDAKDGDVLIVKPTENLGKQLIIFGGIDSNGRIKYYCRFLNNKFSIDGGLMGYEHKYFLPVTKEQRELLFSKMKEAGYKWNTDEKVLVMIGIDNDDEGGRYEELMKDDEISIKQNPSWSKEDEEMFNGCLIDLQFLVDNGRKCNKELYQNEIKWLKGIKDKVQPHWKPTEEQLMALRDAIDNNEMESLYNDLKKL